MKLRYKNFVRIVESDNGIHIGEIYGGANPFLVNILCDYTGYHILKKDLGKEYNGRFVCRKCILARTKEERHIYNPLFASSCSSGNIGGYGGSPTNER